MRVWSLGGDFGDELCCDGKRIAEPCEDNPPLMQFIVDALNEKEARDERLVGTTTIKLTGEGGDIIGRVI